MKVLFIGDVFGSPGRNAISSVLSSIIKEEGVDCCVANGENAAGGNGITHVVAQELYKLGIDALTLGNHTWSKREVLNFIDDDGRIIRPANYPSGVPGKGSAVISVKGKKIGILNLQGRVYMDGIDCPFQTADRELTALKSATKVVVVDMHAEATSEKCALAYHLDGRVSAVLGTHTHVQTADERILPCGTAFISDVGMTGPHDGIIGVSQEIILKKFLTHMPVKFEPAHGRVQFNAVLLDIDEITGKSMSIKRINKII